VVLFLTDIEFAPEDGLDSVLFRRIKEVHRAKDVAVVGHGNSGLTQRLDVLDQLLYVTSAVQQRVIGMQMKMGELGRHSSSLVPLGAEENRVEIRE
jgi:hypothetical protein